MLAWSGESASTTPTSTSETTEEGFNHAVNVFAGNGQLNGSDAGLDEVTATSLMSEELESMGSTMIPPVESTQSSANEKITSAATEDTSQTTGVESFGQNPEATKSSMASTTKRPDENLPGGGVDITTSATIFESPTEATIEHTETKSEQEGNMTQPMEGAGFEHVHPESLETTTMPLLHEHRHNEATRDNGKNMPTCLKHQAVNVER